MPFGSTSSQPDIPESKGGTIDRGSSSTPLWIALPAHDAGKVSILVTEI